MKVKLEWLKELVDIDDISITEIVDKLSLHSIEIESVAKLVDATNLVVGYVKSRNSHPDSDHLSVCLVDVGSETLQIICGAKNVQAGQYVIVALIGAKLPGGVQIKKTKIRGIESSGMICSLLELGIEKKYLDEDNQNGIYVFLEPVKAGADALAALNLSDYVIELGLTPNRGDLLSMLGVAIEVSAVFNRNLKPLAFEIVKEERIKELEIINETDLCKGYFCKVFWDVQIKASPAWLIARLIAFGIRPINNCVDITNYILALFGQPLHAFDYTKLGNKIVIRKATKNEEITTLDKINRKLEEGDILITDGIKPVAIAGVMGGLETEITANTTSLVLEAAVFNSESIRATSLRLGLRSDSSIRFEKGVDLGRIKFALNYASYLLKKYASAKVGETFMDKEVYLPLKSVKITVDEVSKKLGIYISATEIKAILERLKFAVTSNLEIIIPSRRNDIVIKEDIIEEIVRLHGYGHLPPTLPKTDSIGGLTKKQVIRRSIKNILAKLGLNENITYSLISAEENKQFSLINEDNYENIELLMPLNMERRVLRCSLLPSLLISTKFSYNRKLKNLAIFEVGNVYYHKDDYIEEEHLGILLANDYNKSLHEVTKVDFYLLKGIIEHLFNELQVEVQYLPLKDETLNLHPNRSAGIYINDEYIGYLGALHPKYASANDLDDVYIAEIKLNKIYDYEYKEQKYRPVSKLPSIERDLAIVVKKEVLAQDIINLIKSIKNTNLVEINIFDVYSGIKINEDEKSIALNLVFSSHETLTDEIINNKIEKILKELKAKHDAKLRA